MTQAVPEKETECMEVIGLFPWIGVYLAVSDQWLVSKQEVCLLAHLSAPQNDFSFCAEGHKREQLGRPAASLFKSPGVYSDCSSPSLAFS